MDFKSIVSVVADDFAAVDTFIRKSLESDVPLIHEVGHYIVQGGGKRLRPLVCLLTARACGYGGSRHIEVASIIEMLHTATLLHDDVVDESGLRRGRATANARWDNPTAVLVGDYLISRSFALMVALREPVVLDVMSAGTVVIAEGEVLQLINQRDPDTTEERYLQVIYGKTAKLFEVAAETGASLGNRDYQSACATFARHLGAAFQIIDDVLDYTSSADVMGKNVGDDLAEGKPTLPLIQAIKAAPAAEAELIRDAIRTGGLEHLQDIIAIVQRCGALEYTRQRAQAESEQALAALAPLPSSPFKAALEDLTRMALTRNS
ncbi:MAG: Octaprenyl-diphosphate synthase [Moraxellaceae bacterium]|jgi:octaprenyl-diphosphate synthase|nr:Octaprenyl-diphosphate synthase [Moraxellaceae bacterium]MDF3030340.1 Octaprenyl-diphosphate synthase [Moraxellaceae bacterium]